MNDSRPDDTNMLDIPAHRSPSEPTLETLALAEWLAGQRADGETPRLGELFAALPEELGALADAVMADADDRLDGSGEMGEMDDADEPEVLAPGALSPGTQRAVASIFAGGAFPALRGQSEPLARVAETSGGYGYDATVTATAIAGETQHLLALAHGRGFDAETLAGRVMLSTEVVRWLDRVVLIPEHQPEALVAHLVGALGVEREHIQRVLTHGETTVELDDLMRLFASDASLTAAQREYWLSLVYFSG